MSRFEHVGSRGLRQAESAAPLQPFRQSMQRALRAHRHGRFEAALRWYGAALQEDRARPEAWLGQVRALLDMAQPGEALVWLEQAERIIGQTPESLSLQAIAAARCGDLEEAMAFSDVAMRQGRDSPLPWLARAEVVYHRGQRKVARIDLRKAYERAPDPSTARRCGEVALEREDLSAAFEWLEGARAAAPTCPLAAYRMGLYWAKAGHRARAIEALEAALDLESELRGARLALEHLRRGRGRGRWLGDLWRRLRHG